MQHEKTVVLADRFANKVLMFSLETGWGTTVEDHMIVEPRNQGAFRAEEAWGQCL